jgi:hypothetical protein
VRFRRPIFSLLIVLLSVMALAPLSANTASAAPPAIPGGSTYRAVPITGSLPDGGTFVGTFNIQNFANQGGNLVANGTLSGTLTDVFGHVLGTVTNEATALPVTIPGASCQILHLELGPLDLNLLGLTVHLNRVVLDITAQSGPGNLLGNLLCAIAHLLDGGSPLAGLVNFLNRILDQLFPSIPIAGPASTGGNFVGVLTIQNFSAQNGALAATGLLSGNVTNALGQVVRTLTNVLVNLPTAITDATCRILHLTLGPLHLDLLGLVIDLNQVVLNIDAQSGPGNLLGNLLCAIAHLLDPGPGPLAQIAALLNRILTLL